MEEGQQTNGYVLVTADLLQPAFYARFEGSGGTAQPYLEEALVFESAEQAEALRQGISTQRNAPVFTLMPVTDVLKLQGRRVRLSPDARR